LPERGNRRKPGARLLKGPGGEEKSRERAIEEDGKKSRFTLTNGWTGRSLKQKVRNRWDKEWGEGARRKTEKRKKKKRKGKGAYRLIEKRKSVEAEGRPVHSH